MFYDNENEIGLQSAKEMSLESSDERDRDQIGTIPDERQQIQRTVAPTNFANIQNMQ